MCSWSEEVGWSRVLAMNRTTIGEEARGCNDESLNR
jgi:hypothetical protein